MFSFCWNFTKRCGYSGGCCLCCCCLCDTDRCFKTSCVRASLCAPTSECGGVLNNQAGGNFTSPGYLVSNYSNNLNCEWLIQNPRHINSSIVVLIEDLHMENHQTCVSDYLQFRLGEKRHWQLSSSLATLLEITWVQRWEERRKRCMDYICLDVSLLLNVLLPPLRWLRWGSVGQVLWADHPQPSHCGLYPRALCPFQDWRLPGRPGLQGQVLVLW